MCHPAWPLFAQHAVGTYIAGRVEAAGGREDIGLAIETCVAQLEDTGNDDYLHGLVWAYMLNEVTVRDVPLEQVVEANTLLSGLGYESGGLAASHAVAQGYTVLEQVHQRFLHGEMVAMGVLAQLMLEADAEEASRAANFFATVGLPVHLGQLGLGSGDDDALASVVEGAMAFPFLGNMPGEVDHRALRRAILDADELGRGLVD